MANEEKPIEELFFATGKGKYEVTSRAIEWVNLVKGEEEYKKLSQTELVDRALRDVLTGVATDEKMEEINKKKIIAAEKQAEKQSEENAAK